MLIWRRLSWCCLSLLLGCVLVGRLAAEDDRSRTGQAIKLVGNTTFSTDQLFDALLAEPDYLLAMHPYSEPSDQSELVKRYLVGGYRRAGFANVEVDITHVEGGAICRISEGDRFVQDGLSVQGAVEVDHLELVRRLTTPSAASNAFPTFLVVDGEPVTHWVTADGKESDLNDPVWEKGKPVRFDSEVQVGNQLARALNDLGYSQAVVIASFESHPLSKSTSLVVDIVSEGPHDRVDHITIEGNKINDRDQIQRCAGVAVGDLINHRQLQLYTKRLWETGRFRKHNVSFDPKARELTIELEEIPELPPVDQPVSKTAESVLAASRWICTSGRRGEDMEISISLENWQLRSIQSQAGFFLEAKLKQDDDAKQNGGVISLLIDSDRLLLDHSHHPRRFLVSPMIVDGKIEFTTGLGAATGDQGFARYWFTFNASSDRDAHETPLQHSWNISPSDWLPFAYKPNFETRWDGSLMTLAHKENQIVIDTETGQVVKIAGFANLRFAAGLYEAEKTRILKETEAKPNALNPPQPISSFASYVLSEPCRDQATAILQTVAGQQQPANSHLIPAFEKLVDGGLLSGLDAVACKLIASDKADSESFSIPYQPRGKRSFNTMMLELGARVVLKYAPEFLADDGWPMKLTREACLVVVGRTKHTGRVMQELLADQQPGPLCYGLMAYGLCYVNRNTAKIFADRALRKMNPEAFHGDLQALTAATNSDLVTRTLTSVKTLNDDELSAIIGLSTRPWFAEFVRLAHSHPIGESERSTSEFWYRATKDRFSESMQAMLR